MIDGHSHTIFSDGLYEPEINIMNAVKNGVNKVGISDHSRAFFEKSPHYMAFDVYVEKLKSLKEKYRGRIEVLIGLELNVNFKDKDDENKIPYEKLGVLDYVLFERIEGFSYYEEPGANCLKFNNIGRIAERIKCKKGLAHTDIISLAQNYSENKGWEHGVEYILDIMKKHHIYWEINIQEQYEYFDRIINNPDDYKVKTLFKKIREKNLEMIAGSDTHYLSWDYDIERLRLANRIANGEFIK